MAGLAALELLPRSEAWAPPTSIEPSTVKLIAVLNVLMLLVSTDTTITINNRATPMPLSKWADFGLKPMPSRQVGRLRYHHWWNVPTHMGNVITTGKSRERKINWEPVLHRR
jgi:hypothetical protein